MFCGSASCTSVLPAPRSGGGYSTARKKKCIRLRTSPTLCICFVFSASRSAVRASERRTARRASLLGHRTIWALPWSLQSLPCRLSGLNQYAYLPPPTGVCIACVLPVPSAFLVVLFPLLRRADSDQLSTKAVLLSHPGYPFDWNDSIALLQHGARVHHCHIPTNRGQIARIYPSFQCRQPVTKGVAATDDQLNQRLTAQHSTAILRAVRCNAANNSVGGVDKSEFASVAKELAVPRFAALARTSTAPWSLTGSLRNEEPSATSRYCVKLLPSPRRRPSTPPSCRLLPPARPALP